VQNKWALCAPGGGYRPENRPTGKNRRIYTYGPLIHNPQTIELLKKRGIISIGRIEEIKDQENAILIIRAHGIAPAERKKYAETV
jgi:4-hydroxy-3-methylbut-2-enyl diphosphate reductase IspH